MRWHGASVNQACHNSGHRRSEANGESLFILLFFFLLIYFYLVSALLGGDGSRKQGSGGCRLSVEEYKGLVDFVPQLSPTPGGR